MFVIGDQWECLDCETAWDGRTTKDCWVCGERGLYWADALQERHRRRLLLLLDRPGAPMD